MSQANDGAYYSYFWLFAPAGDIVFKKPVQGNLSDIFAQEAQGKSADLWRIFAQDSCRISKKYRHLTVFEQPKVTTRMHDVHVPPQPIENKRDLRKMVAAMQEVADDYMPLRYGMHGMEILQKRKNVSVVLNLNDEARDTFDEFYTDMMGRLFQEFDVHDYYEGERVPHVTVARASRKDVDGILPMRKGKICQAVTDFNNAYNNIKTKPIAFDRLMLAQSLYNAEGYRLAERRVATLNFDSKPFEWHCDDPFDRITNAQLIEETRQRRAQGQANGRQFPLLVA